MLAVEAGPGTDRLMIAWTILAVGILIAVVVHSRLRGRSILHAGDASATPPLNPPVAGEQGVPLELPDDPAARRAPVVGFLAAGLCGFTAWFLAQVIFVMVAPPRLPAGAGAGAASTWRPIELAILMLCSGLTGWGGSILVLQATGATRAAGYRLGRLFRALMEGVVGIIVALPIVQWAAELTLKVLARLGIEHDAKHPLLQSIDDSPDVLVISIASLAAVVAAPLFEELLFRGLIQNAVTRMTRHAWAGILLASLLFALIHPDWTRPPIFVLSLLLGIVYHRTQNLWGVTLMHALFNAYAMATNIITGPGGP